MLKTAMAKIIYHEEKDLCPCFEDRLNSWTSSVLNVLMDRFSKEDCPIPGLKLSGISLSQIKDEITTVSFSFNREDKEQN